MAPFIFCMPFRQIRSWRKTSKCNKLITALSYRLKLLQTRKSVIITQTREDITWLLQVDQFQLAVKLAAELHREQNRIAAYQVISEICDCISENISYITKERDLPADVSVSISSLIFAASRCGELPELNKLRNLFREWYGNQLDAANVNLLPSNLVKSELKKTLSFNPISDTVKLDLINEIIRDSDVTMRLPQNGQQDVYDVSGGKSVSKEEDGVVDAETRTIPKFCVHEAVGKMLQIPEAGSKLVEDATPRESTDSTYQILEKEIVYLDDISRTSPSPHYNTLPQIPPQNTTLRSRMPLCGNISVEPLPQHISNLKKTKLTESKQCSPVNGAEPVHRTWASRKLCQGYQGEIKNCINHQRPRATLTSSSRGQRRE